MQPISKINMEEKNTNPEKILAFSHALDLTFSLEAKSSGLIGCSVHTSHAGGNIAVCVPCVRLETSGTWDKQLSHVSMESASRINYKNLIIKRFSY